MADHTITIGEDGARSSPLRKQSAPRRRRRPPAWNRRNQRLASETPVSVTRITEPVGVASRVLTPIAVARVTEPMAIARAIEPPPFAPHPRAAPLWRITQPAGEAPVGDPLAEADDRVILRCAGGLFGAVGRLVRVAVDAMFGHGPQEVLALVHTIGVRRVHRPGRCEGVMDEDTLRGYDQPRGQFVSSLHSLDGVRESSPARLSGETPGWRGRVAGDKLRVWVTHHTAMRFVAPCSGSSTVEEEELGVSPKAKLARSYGAGVLERSRRPATC